jgi:alcohol dehydrogenase (cytochrome c)
MPASDLDGISAWQVLAFLRDVVLKANPYRTIALPDAATDASVRAVETLDLERAPGDGSEWLTYSGDYSGQRHSPLTEITPANVSRLQLKWFAQLHDDVPSQATPIVVGDTLFIASSTGEVRAFDSMTGVSRWSYAGHAMLPIQSQSVDGLNVRGVAVAGHAVLVPMIDGRLVALDSSSGRMLWSTQVADPKAGYSMTAAPLVVGDKAIVGVAGSDRGVRGFLDAYTIRDGHRAWRFYTIPGPGEPGHDSWGPGAAWRRGGGVTSVTGTYDHALNLIFWGTATPSPAFQGDVRPGDNLFTSSILALEPNTGRLRWHHQIAPHDEHDWGVTHVPILPDAREAASSLVVASRDGFVYVLDRATGHFAKAIPFAYQTWNDGFTSSGRPIERPDTRPSAGGVLVYPGHAGATNWSPPAYDPNRGLLYVLTREGYASIYYRHQLLTWPDGAYWGGRAGQVMGTTVVVDVRAIELKSGQIRWTYKLPGTLYSGLGTGGILSTTTGVVFAADKGRLAAIDAGTGRELWVFDVDGPIDAPPITYRSGGRQYVVIAAGQILLGFALAP